MSKTEYLENRMLGYLGRSATLETRMNDFDGKRLPPEGEEPASPLAFVSRDALNDAFLKHGSSEIAEEIVRRERAIASAESFFRTLDTFAKREKLDD